ESLTPSKQDLGGGSASGKAPLSRMCDTPLGHPLVKEIVVRAGNYLTSIRPSSFMPHSDRGAPGLPTSHGAAAPAKETGMHLSMRRSRPKRGFTLIELLVVIAIIAILAAILFPVFAQARAKARSISCLSNVKQFGNAFHMYVQDYDETCPSMWGGSGSCQPSGHNCSWEWWFGL